MTCAKKIGILLQVIICCLLSSWSDAALAMEALSAQTTAEANAEAIVSLTNQLLVKEIDLEHYYLQYRLDASKEPSTRRLRFFILQQAATGGFVASSIINTAEPAKHFKSPEQASTKVYKRSMRIGAISSVLGAASSGLELCSNSGIALKNKWHGEDPASACRTVIERLREIDELFSRRELLVQAIHDRQRYDICQAETKVLKSFRDWCVYEFADVYADTKSYQSSNNVFYAIDTGAYITSFASYIFTLKSFGRARFAYPGLYNGFVSDSMFTVEAPASAVAYSWLYKMAWNKVVKQLKENPVDVEPNAKKQMVQLEALVANAEDATLSLTGPTASRLAIYSFWSSRYDKFIDRRMKNMRRLSRLALQSEISGPLIASTGLAADVEYASALYGYKANPFMQNALYFAGSAALTCGTAASLGLSGWWFIDDLRNTSASRRDHTLPEQLLQDRLRTLDLLKQMVL